MLLGQEKMAIYPPSRTDRIVRGGVGGVRRIGYNNGTMLSVSTGDSPGG